jgi:serine/threonine-protein kinase RsbW
MTDKLFLEIPSKLRYLRLASSFGLHAAQSLTSEEHSIQNDFPDVLELALTEAVTNAIRHRNQNSSESSIVVEIRLNRDDITVMVKDTNPPFDAELVPVPDLDAHPENGYGIYIIRKIMDVVETNRENGWNILTMKKDLRSSS